MGNYNLHDIYSSEVIVGTWFSVSLFLLTCSLLFYHMTKVSSLELNPTLAGIFAISLMILSVSICIISVHNYYKRVIRATKSPDKENMADFKEEKRLSTAVFIGGIILCIVEIGITISIIVGTSNKL